MDFTIPNLEKAYDRAEKRLRFGEKKCKAKARDKTGWGSVPKKGEKDRDKRDCFERGHYARNWRTNSPSKRAGVNNRQRGDRLGSSGE